MLCLGGICGSGLWLKRREVLLFVWLVVDCMFGCCVWAGFVVGDGRGVVVCKFGFFWVYLYMFSWF